MVSWRGGSLCDIVLIGARPTISSHSSRQRVLAPATKELGRKILQTRPVSATITTQRHQQAEIKNGRYYPEQALLAKNYLPSNASPEQSVRSSASISKQSEGGSRHAGCSNAHHLYFVVHSTCIMSNYHSSRKPSVERCPNICELAAGYTCRIEAIR